MRGQFLIFSKNLLSGIASNEGYPYNPGTNSPELNAGQLYFALTNETTSTYHKAYIYLDDNTQRYYVTSPIDWNEILHKPLDYILTSFFSTSSDSHDLELTYLSGATATTSLPFVLLSGDTMTGPLGIAASTTDGAPKVQLSYNATTESLDFIFT